MLASEGFEKQCDGVYRSVPVPPSPLDMTRVMSEQLADDGRGRGAVSGPGAGPRAGDINEFLDVVLRTKLTVPLMASTVACDFPSPADDYLDSPLVFNELLISNPAATFAVRISGESMTGAGLFPCDVALVNRSLTPSNGSIALALINGEFTSKCDCIAGGGIGLLADNSRFMNIKISAETALEVWGTVKHAIRML